jgi:hypothetical protein
VQEILAVGLRLALDEEERAAVVGAESFGLVLVAAALLRRRRARGQGMRRPVRFQ